MIDETDRIVRALEVLACAVLVASDRSRVEAIESLDAIDRLLGDRDERRRAEELARLGNRSVTRRSAP